MIILDASAVIAFLQRTDEHHLAASAHLARSNPPFLIHAITLAEVLVEPARRGWAEQVAADLSALGVTVANLGPTEHTLLAQTRAAHGLRMPDTCVLATAIHAKAPILTFDLRLAAAAQRLGLLLTDPSAD